MRIDERLEHLVSELDTAVGMLTVAAMRDAEVNAAKQKVMDVSGQLSDIINELLDDEDDLSDLR